MVDGLIAHESTSIWLVALWGLSAAMVAFSAYWYRDVLNPMAAAVVSDVVLPCALSATTAYSLLGQATYGAVELNRAIYVSLVFAVGVCAGCLVPVRPFDRLITWPFRTASRAGGAESTQVGRVLFLCIGIGAFGLMAVWGGGGSLWLFSPREAYIAYRSGVGPFWLLAEWCLMLWLIASIWCERRGLRVLGLVAMACCLAAFFGSKAVVLSVILVTLMHRHLNFRPLRAWVWFGSSLLLLAGFLLLLHFQSGGEARWQMYSREYVDTVCRAFQGTDLMKGDMLGAAFLSSLWGLVPRSIYPDKPYEYGVLLLHAQLFPGMAEKGSTPGVAPWTLAYMDLGVFGAVLAGLVSGRIRDAFHRAYTHQRNSIVMFVAYMQFSLWPFLLYASPAITFALCGVLALTTRLRRPGTAHPIAGAASRCSK
jgi:hypothetical protein